MEVNDWRGAVMYAELARDCARQKLLLRLAVQYEQFAQKTKQAGMAGAFGE